MTSKQHPGGSAISLDGVLDTDSEGGDADNMSNIGEYFKMPYTSYICE